VRLQWRLCCVLPPYFLFHEWRRVEGGKGLDFSLLYTLLMIPSSLIPCSHEVICVVLLSFGIYLRCDAAQCAAGGRKE
jgi:hypothetical protein